MTIRQAAPKNAHESQLVRCSPHAPGFSQSNLQGIQAARSAPILNTPPPLLQKKATIPMNPFVSNQFPQSQSFSVRVTSLKARFTDYHKQDFSFFAPNLNCKVISILTLNQPAIINSRHSHILLYFQQLV